MPDQIQGEGQEPSLRDTIAAGFDKAEEKETEQPQAESETAEQKAERIRDEKGRFAPRAEAKTEVQTQTVAPEAKPRPSVPKSWKSDYHPHWEKIDPTIAEYINQREEEMSRGAELIKADAKMGKELMAEINPYMDMIRAEGGTPATAIRDAIRTAAVLRQADPIEKARILLQVGQQYGADFKSILNGQAPQPQFDPRMVEQTIEEKFQARAANEEVNRLKSDGKHEYLEELRVPMASLLQADLATDLEDAYQKALRLNTSLFEATQAKAKQAEEEKKRNEAIQAATAAKSRAISPKTSTPASRTANAGSGLRDSYQDAFDAKSGRV